MTGPVSHIEARQGFRAFIEAREAIRLKRERGEPAPWTQDPILQRYSFTNVKREHDRTTRWIWEWHDQALAMLHPRPELAMVLAVFGRYYGLPWLREVPVTVDVDKYILRVAEEARRRMAAGLPTYTGAYMITTASRRIPKIDHITIVAQDLRAIAREIHTAWEAQSSWQAMVEDMTTVPCVGDFMAKEISLDLIRSWPFRDALARSPDAETWTPFGPGGIRGLKRVFPGILPALYQEACTTLRHYVNDTKERWMPELTQHDVQFQLCEFDKYERARLGQGRLKRLYHHRSQS